MIKATELTPQQIAERCAEIRATWDLRTEQKRRGLLKKASWGPPIVRCEILCDSDDVLDRLSIDDV